MEKTEPAVSARGLGTAVRDILPVTEINLSSNSISMSTEKSPQSFLRQFHLFPLTHITLPIETEDAVKLVTERYQNVLAAAYGAKLTMLTAFHGSRGKVTVYSGFRADREEDRKVFRSVFEGVFPGSLTEFDSDLQLDRLATNLVHGGMVSAIPTLRIEDERQVFRISSVVRSMYDENYLLLVMSRPVDELDVRLQYRKLLDARSICHKHAVVTRLQEKGSGESEQSQVSESSSTGFGLILMSNRSSTEGKGTGKERHWSESLSVEEQNGLAVEMEKIADSFIERIKKALNVGYWESTITFACETETGCKILGASLLGELSRPSANNLPARVYFSQLEKEKVVLLPAQDSADRIFPRSLCSYITSEELAMLAAPPTESLPGFEVKRMPALALTDPKSGEGVGTFPVGNITDFGMPLAGSPFTLSRGDLAKHVFVAGITGSGKTTTVREILKSAEVPFLVLESAKRDYRQLLADDRFGDTLRVYTIGDATIAPLLLNPFYLMPGVFPLSHIDFLKAIFNASFSLYGPMPHILEQCLHNVYMKRGWNLTLGGHPFFLNEEGKFDPDRYKIPEHSFCFPTLTDLADEVDTYMRCKLGYEGELSANIRTAILTRLQSLSVGAKGQMFNTRAFPDIKDLLSHPTVFELEALSDDDDKAFFVGLMLVLISEHRQTHNPIVNPSRSRNKVLEHILVIEEAHRLLKNVETERVTEMMGNPKGKAVETFCNVISEMRSLGQGTIVVEQIPSKIARDVVKNTNTKIVHRLVGRDDQLLLAGAMGMTENEALYFSQLPTGHALCHKERMERPVEVQVLSDRAEIPVYHDTIHSLMNRRPGQKPLLLVAGFEVNDIRLATGRNGEAVASLLLNTLAVCSAESVSVAVESAFQELERIVKRESYGGRFGRETLTEFLVQETTAFLSQGLYSPYKCPPDGFMGIMRKVLQQPNESTLYQIKGLLKKSWGTNDAGVHIVGLVAALITNGLLEKHIVKPDEVLLGKLVPRYFLLRSHMPVKAVIESIRNEMEDTFYD